MLLQGSRGISFVLSAIIFNVAPTIVELSLVCGILVTIGSYSHTIFTPPDAGILLWTNLCSGGTGHSESVRSLHPVGDTVENTVQSEDEQGGASVL